MDYTDSFVSSAMDGVRRFIANADDRPEDEIERADTALAGVAAQSLGTGSVSHVYVYTTDVAAGRAVEAVFDGEGYGDAITYVNAFRLIEDLIDCTAGLPLDDYSVGRVELASGLVHWMEELLVPIFARRDLNSRDAAPGFFYP